MAVTWLLLLIMIPTAMLLNQDIDALAKGKCCEATVADSGSQEAAAADLSHNQEAAAAAPADCSKTAAAAADHSHAYEAAAADHSLA